MAFRLSVCVQIFGQDWWINVWWWKTGCLRRKLHNFLGKIFFSLLQICTARTRVVQPVEKMMMSSWHYIKKKTNFFICLDILGMIMHMLKLLCIYEIWLYWDNYFYYYCSFGYNFLCYTNNVVLSYFVEYLNLLWHWKTLVWLPIAILSVSSCANWDILNSSW